MKKIVSILLVVALFFSLCCVSFADDYDLSSVHGYVGNTGGVSWLDFRNLKIVVHGGEFDYSILSDIYNSYVNNSRELSRRTLAFVDSDNRLNLIFTDGGTSFPDSGVQFPASSYSYPFYHLIFDFDVVNVYVHTSDFIVSSVYSAKCLVCADSIDDPFFWFATVAEGYDVKCGAPVVSRSSLKLFDDGVYFDETPLEFHLCSFDYVSNGNETHTVSCLVDGCDRAHGVEKCNTDGENGSCSLCGYQPHICTYEYICNGDGTHVKQCVDSHCDVSVVESCGVSVAGAICNKCWYVVPLEGGQGSSDFLDNGEMWEQFVVSFASSIGVIAPVAILILGMLIGCSLIPYVIGKFGGKR